MNVSFRRGRLAAAASILVLLASCGGGETDRGGAVAQGARERALAVPPGAPADAATKGMFGPIRNWPLIAVHGVLTSDGRVLSYGTNGDGQQTGSFIYDVWDPQTDSHMTLPNGTTTDLFCSSQLLLPGGQSIVISGGDNFANGGTTNTGNNRSNLFNVANNTLTAGAGMNRTRWYSSSTMLLNGEIYIQGGSGGTDRPEIRGSDGAYRLLSGADTNGYDYMYPRNFIAPDGRVFGFDSNGRMYYVNTAGSGSIAAVGSFNGLVAGSDSSAAMFAPGRILQYGGNSNQSLVIDISGASTPVVTQSGAMLRQRKLSSATLLADGKVVATGGSSTWNQMIDVSYEAEVWNPQTGQWTVGASAVKPRLYHGNALLLPDATVLVFGGGAPAPEGLAPGNLDAEIYYPPYLFAPGGAAALRPKITAAPTVVDVGSTVQVTVTSARPVARVTFVKSGSATHGWNMDQRFVDLPFNAQGGVLSVQIPARASDVPPGTWMMFVFDDAGVPSEMASMVRVNVAGALNTGVTPVLTSPGNQSTVAGTAVSLQPSAFDPNGDVLTWSAGGLPPGLSINASTGRISGTPGTVGIYTVVLAASDGINSASATITWTVNSAAPMVLAAPPPALPSVAGAGATFTASATGINVRYRWDFGDGSAWSDWSESSAATHVFSAPGAYYVTVMAIDDRGIQQQRSVLHNVYLAPTAGKPSVSSALLIETRTGARPRLWVVNPDNDSVTVFDAVTRAKLAEIAVGAAPRTLALAPGGASVWVANKRGASLSVIATSNLAVSRTVALRRGSQPYGIAFAGSTPLVALEGSGELVKLDAASGNVIGTLAVGANPRHVSVAADGATAFVARFITPPLPGESTLDVQTTGAGGQLAGGEVVVVNVSAMSSPRTVTLAHSDLPDSETQGRGFPNYLGALAISPDGTQGYVPSKQDNLRRGAQRDGLPLNFQSTVRAISSRVVLATQSEDLSSRIDHDNSSVAGAAAFDPLGIYLFVALETSREVAVLDAHRRNELMRIDVGRAPQALAVSADRRTLYVSNFMDRTVGVFDLAPLVQQGVVSAVPVATLSAVGTEKLAANVLKGKQLFYDARDPRLAFDRYMSCASCHNDGGHDGRVWDLKHMGEGLRNTISLRGRASLHGQLHWSGNFDEVQDFENQIRALAQGTGLMSNDLYATRADPLGAPKAGASADLDALAAYVASLNSFDPSPYRPNANALSAAAANGKALFASMNCASCHAGTGFTRSALGSLNGPADIGTIKPSSGQRLSGALTGIDVPTLRDVWTSAPYLHDGSAATLPAAIRAHNTLAAGVTDAQVNDLASYLREIGSDEPSAPPVPAGTGLVGRYYSGTSMSGSVLMTRSEGVDFDWNSGSPGSGVPKDNFSVRWTGWLTIPSSGAFVFRTVADDGARLWVDGSVPRIDAWGNSPSVNTAAPIAFVAGQKVPIRLEYYARKGQAEVRLQWQVPGNSGFVAIPSSYLSAN